MIHSNVKKTFQLTAMVFTAMILIQMLSGQKLDNDRLYDSLACSVVAALLRYSLFRGVLFEFSIWTQLVYLSLVWLMVIASNFLFHWGMSKQSIVTSPIMVLAVYLVIRLFNYQLEKLEVKKMNELLEKNRENK